MADARTPYETTYIRPAPYARLPLFASAAGQLDQFRVPVSTVERRDEPFEKRNARPVCVRDSGSAICNSLLASVQVGKQVLCRRLSAQRLADPGNVGKHVVQVIRRQVNELR